MFQSLHIINNQLIDNGGGLRRYMIKIVDDEFETETHPILINGGCGTAGGLDCLLNFYSRKNTNIAKNICKFYLYSYKNDINGMEAIIYWIKRDREWMETYAPQYKYTKRYYNCVISQLKKEIFDNLYIVGGERNNE